jgi:choline dehydrogenase
MSSLISLSVDLQIAHIKQVSSDADILALIKKSVGSVFHASCTCAMGKASDKNAVVDSNANVIGVNRLRVVDASAFPFLPPGHPMATVCKFKPFEQS